MTKVLELVFPLFGMFCFIMSVADESIRRDNFKRMVMVGLGLILVAVLR